MEAQIVVQRPVAPGRCEEAGRHVQQHGRRRLAALERRGVEERLQRGARLPGRQRHVDLPRAFLGEVGAAHQREQRATLRVEHDDRAVACIALRDAAQVGAHGSDRLALQVAVEGGVDDEARTPGEVRAEPREFLVHHRREVRRERRLALLDEGQSGAGGLRSLFGRDHPVGYEAIERVALPDERAGGLAGVSVHTRQLRQAREVARLHEVEMAGADTEVEARRRLDAVRATAVVDVVEIRLDQLGLRMSCFELQGDQRLARLAQQRGSVGLGRVEQTRQLLRERRGAARLPLPRGRVGQRARHREDVDAGVPPEALVLGGNGGVHGDRGDLIEAHGDAHALGRITQQRSTVAIDNHRTGGRRLLIEWRQRSEVCVGQQCAGCPEAARSGREADPQQRAGRSRRRRRMAIVRIIRSCTRSSSIPPGRLPAHRGATRLDEFGWPLADETLGPARRFPELRACEGAWAPARSGARQCRQRFSAGRGCSRQRTAA